MESLKRPNSNIIAKMKLIANILQHRTLMEQLGPLASPFGHPNENGEEEKEQFRPSLLLGRASEEDDERNDKNKSCILL